MAPQSCLHVLLVCCDIAGLRLDWAEEDQRRGSIISVPPEVYSKGCVQDVDEGLAVSSLITLQITVKGTHTLVPVKLLVLSAVFLDREPRKSAIQ